MMIVKTPLKDKKVRRNRRSNGKTKTRSFKSTRRNGNGTGTVYGKRKTKSSENKLSLPDFSAWKVILGAIVIGAFGVLYLSHVFATQELLREVEQLENEYNEARRRHADYRLTYDRLTGPKEIYEKAKELGFINGGPADKVIEVEGD